MTDNEANSTGEQVTMTQSVTDTGSAGNQTETTFTRIISHPFFKNYALDDDDMKIISRLFDNLLDGRDGIKTTELLKILAPEKKKTILGALKRLWRLKGLGILQSSWNRDEDADSMSAMLRSTLNLSGDAINALFEDGEERDIEPSDLSEPYHNNIEYLADQFERLDYLISESFVPHRLSKIVRKRIYRSARVAEMGLRNFEKKIEERLKLSKTIFLYEEFKRQKGLSRSEELIILALLKNEMFGGECLEAEELLDFISDSAYNRLANMRLFENGSRLIKEGMIDFVEPNTRNREKLEVRLGPKLLRLLIGKERRHRRDKPANGFFEVTRPTVSLDQVILPKETLSAITLSIGMIQGRPSERLREWGFKHNLQTADGGNKQPVIMLFYGPPGTGKTLAANAMANTLKKKVLTLDCTKIMDKWVGESQKNTRMIFDKYRDISKRTKNLPVLLLNEADQLLQKRMEVRRSVDAMYNQMQNIFLEQMENFKGILIATTNLEDHLDQAFSRRFHQKIEFKKPGSEERARLWRLHIPEKAPLTGDVDFDYLAECYPFTGGQIAVAVRNAAAQAAIRGDVITVSDLIDAAERENKGTFETKAMGKIGF